MDNLPLKVKKKIILDYLDDIPIEKTASELKISLDEIKNVLEEWKNGYISIYTGEIEISEELRELARIMKSKELTIEEILKGYFLSQIFKNQDEDKIIKIAREIESLDDVKRKEFLETAEKMLKLSKYKNINYVDIPDALEEMVNKGKELNKEIKEKESILRSLEQNLNTLNINISNLKEQESKLKKEIEFAEKIKNYLTKFKIEEKKIEEFLKFLSETDYSVEKWEEIYKAMDLLKQKNMDVENFTKLSSYLTSLLNMGFTTSFIKVLQSELEEESLDINEFMKEIEDYIKNKITYRKEIDELKKEKKNLENQIRSMRSEIKEYFKKVKPKMQ
ncbi:MAG: hypothetical protein ACP5SF_03735 [Thermoplasmata archaeon]